LAPELLVSAEEIMSSYSRLSIAILTALALLAALLPAQTFARTAHAPTTINVWNYATGYEEKVFQAAYNRFNRAQSAVRVAGTWGVNNDKTLTAISGGKPPDVVDLGGADPLCSWAAKGALTDLGPYLKASHVDLSSFVPQALSYGTCNGKYYGITGAFDGLFLILQHGHPGQGAHNAAPYHRRARPRRRAADEGEERPYLAARLLT
jgi:ABC-type glycerol-3-phosphate transport system substrate-binding protein